MAAYGLGVLKWNRWTARKTQSEMGWGEMPGPATLLVATQVLSVHFRSYNPGCPYQQRQLRTFSEHLLRDLKGLHKLGTCCGQNLPPREIPKEPIRAYITTLGRTLRKLSTTCKRGQAWAAR